MASDDKRRLTLWKRKAWKSNGLTGTREETNCLVKKQKWSLRSNCSGTQSGGFCFICQMMLHSTAASNHSGYKIALNNLLYWNLKSRVGSYWNQYKRNLIRIFRRMESVPSCLGFFRSVVTHNTHWWVGLYQRTNLLKFRCEQNSNITRI